MECSNSERPAKALVRKGIGLLKESIGGEQGIEGQN